MRGQLSPGYGKASASMKISSRITVEDIRKLGWEEDHQFNRSVDALKKRIALKRYKGAKLGH
jgi:hypothetical protein